MFIDCSLHLFSFCLCVCVYVAQNQILPTLMDGAPFSTGSIRSWWALLKMSYLWNSKVCKEMGSCSMEKVNVETKLPWSYRRGDSSCISIWVGSNFYHFLSIKASGNSFCTKLYLPVFLMVYLESIGAYYKWFFSFIQSWEENHHIMKCLSYRWYYLKQNNIDNRAEWRF